MTARPTRLMTSRDILDIKVPSDPNYSPDGKRVAYVVWSMDEKADGYVASIHVADADGSSSLRLTTADARDTSPRWSPDGKHLAFLSTRAEKPQIWMIRAAGGEAWQVSELDEGVAEFAWSPDGSHIVAVSKSVTPSGDEPADEAEKSDVKHITRIRYKSDDEGFLDFKTRHLWIVPAFGGEARQLTHADNHASDPIWSPNGREIAFVTNRSEGREWNNVSEIWVVLAAGGGERPLLSGDSASFGSPSWSPDGSRLAAVGDWEAVAGGSPDSDIWIVPAGGGDAANITEGFGRSVGDAGMSDMYRGSSNRPIWTPDGSHLYFITSDSGNSHIYRVPAEGGEVKKVTSGNRRISAMALNSDASRMAYIAATPINPGDVYTASGEGQVEVRLTKANADFLNGIALTDPEEFWVPSPSDGTSIQGWILKPPGFDPARKYPMILQIHGGPHAMYANAFMHEFHLMAARGYVVVYTNPRGSSGYGEAFTRASHLRWGETDMPDVMAAVDHVLSLGYVDESRMGVTGGSYGGFMTLWVIGHTDRFKAAVTQRCVSNLYSFYGTSDIGWGFIDYQFGGKAWERREHFMKYSPISYVEQMTTPLLIVHSERDFRCPIEQAEQVFISLKKLGREVEFVRVPDETHNLSRTGKPKHRQERLEYIVGWFDSHL